LTKLNAFDFVVTIALGSTLGTILLDSRTSLSDGVIALALLITLQRLVATMTSRVTRLRPLLTASQPSWSCAVSLAWRGCGEIA
jgi:uncharacterized membrane protein YcaP (DUF421 family)